MVDAARRKSGPEAGGQRRRVDLSDVSLEAPGSRLDILALNDALDTLSAIDPRAADLVKLRFFVGFTRQQAADALGVSLATVDNDWAYAKGWLQVELSGSAERE